MKAKKLLSAVITVVMCLNLFAGTGFALEEPQTADTSQADGIELESSADEPGGSVESTAGDADYFRTVLTLMFTDLPMLV